MNIATPTTTTTTTTTAAAVHPRTSLHSHRIIGALLFLLLADRASSVRAFAPKSPWPVSTERGSRRQSASKSASSSTSKSKSTSSSSSTSASKSASTQAVPRPRLPRLPTRQWSSAAVGEEATATGNENVKSNVKIYNNENGNSKSNENSNNNNDDDESILARLFGSPSARDAFFANDFGKNVVHVPSSNRDDDVCSLDLPCIVDVDVDDVDDSDSDVCDDDNAPAPTAAATRRATRLDLEVLFDSSEFIALRKRGSMAYVDKETTSYRDFCDYVAGGGSAVVPVAGGSVLAPFLEDLGRDFGRRLRPRPLSPPSETTGDENENENAAGLDSNANATATTTTTTTNTTATTTTTTNTTATDSIADTLKVGINVYHSGPGAVALNRHFDQYDVLVVHLDGRKQWEIGVFGEEAERNEKQKQNVDLTDANRIESVAHWINVTLVPGDLLYIPKGVYHAATTADGYESTTHATIGLEY